MPDLAEKAAAGAADTPATDVQPAPAAVVAPAPALVAFIVALGVAAVLLALQILLFGPGESNETRTWVLMFAVAVPVGIGAATWREPSWTGVAVGAAALAAVTFWHYFVRHNTPLLDLLLLAAGLVAALGPPLLREWRHVDRLGPLAAAVTAAGLMVMVPQSSLLTRALAIGAIVGGLLWTVLRARITVPRWAGIVLDLVCVVVLVGVVATLPPLETRGYGLVHHHGFFLGPANDVIHGRPMLVDTWSQYGVGVIDFLALFFSTNAIGYGHLFLLCVGLMCLQYLTVMATLRAAGLGRLIVVFGLAVAVFGNVIAASEFYGMFPSTTPLRFGWPYLVVLLAVLEQRGWGWTRWARLLVVAISAVWSAETFVYTAATFASIELILALRGGAGWWRRLLRPAAYGLGVSVGAVALYSLVTLIVWGAPNWQPYLDLVKLYADTDIAALPVDLVSAGPLMGLAIFGSAIVLLRVTSDAPERIPPAVAVALAGYTGFAISSFSYYLGRSHPTNLLHLWVPVVSLGVLWLWLALREREAATGASRRALTIAAVLLIGIGTVGSASTWESTQVKWPSTALAQALPGDAKEGQLSYGSLRTALRSIWQNPAFDQRAPIGSRMLRRAEPGANRSLVLTEPDLTTEILLLADRSNVLPIAHPLADQLIPGSTDRVKRVAEQIPAGTLMLFSPVMAPGTVNVAGAPSALLPQQTAALEVLQRRFTFRTVESDPSGMKLVRLEPRAAPAGGQVRSDG